MTLRANGVTIEIEGDADVSIEGDRVTVRTVRVAPPLPSPPPLREERLSIWPWARPQLWTDYPPVVLT